MPKSDYILARGAKGRERLRILARVMRGGTLPLLDNVGIAEGEACLDVGCGGGDVSLLLGAWSVRRDGLSVSIKTPAWCG